MLPMKNTPDSPVNSQASTSQHVRISQLEIPLSEVAAQIGGRASPDQHLKSWIAVHCGITEDDVLSYTIRRRSVDARRKPHIRLIYSVEAVVRERCPIREDAQTQVCTPEPEHTHWLYHL
ncbi:hypothetical protein GF339_18745, partial [candidate division KSB3 bacterium]|nr:hypothetical protein [candidate division KSB3 bacterium]MBD3326629.1 hypothetical protein [candidate division KSB3 bacterium]